IIVLFAGIAFLTNYQQEEATKGNPYGKEDLHPETIKQLDDPNYQSLILPEELEKRLDNNEDVTVYFYASDCPHCQQTTPVLMPLAEELGADVVQYNLLEFQEGWGQYNIEYTPTLVQFENGEETARIVGSQPESEFEKFFKQYTLNK
ncbi:MAG TPA: thioredoxin family protein, partial [Chondromyces sp.]|nr:thioredoxin family protein [Chondromyces sp.]